MEMPQLSKQLLMVPTESLTNREWLPGELLSGFERQRPGWFLDTDLFTLLRPLNSIIGFAFTNSHLDIIAYCMLS